jgi:hypothetical protein
MEEVVEVELAVFEMEEVALAVIEEVEEVEQVVFAPAQHCVKM